MRYQCEILNHGIDGYEVWLHGRNQGRSGVRQLYRNLLKEGDPDHSYVISNVIVDTCLFFRSVCDICIINIFSTLRDLRYTFDSPQVYVTH